MDFEKYRKKKKVITIHLDEETKQLLDSYLKRKQITKQEFLEQYIIESTQSYIKQEFLNLQGGNY